MEHLATYVNVSTFLHVLMNMLSEYIVLLWALSLVVTAHGQSRFIYSSIHFSLSALLKQILGIIFCFKIFIMYF